MRRKQVVKSTLVVSLPVFTAACHWVFSALFYTQITKAVWVQENSRWAGYMLQGTAWAPSLPLPSQQEVDSQATLGFRWEQRQRGRDMRAVLKTEW